MAPKYGAISVLKKTHLHVLFKLNKIIYLFPGHL